MFQCFNRFWISTKFPHLPICNEYQFSHISNHLQQQQPQPFNGHLARPNDRKWVQLDNTEKTSDSVTQSQPEISIMVTCGPTNVIAIRKPSAQTSLQFGKHTPVNAPLGSVSRLIGQSLNKFVSIQLNTKRSGWSCQESSHEITTWIISHMCWWTIS